MAESPSMKPSLKIKLFSLFASVLILFPVASYATGLHEITHSTSYRIEGDVGILLISGEINAETSLTAHTAFSSFYQANVKSIIIHINSLGGMYGRGKLVIQDMDSAKQYGIKVITFVDHQEQCASMCTGIFANGQTRIAAEDSVWVFHAPYVNQGSETTSQMVIDSAIKEAQAYMLNLYTYADPQWTKEVLSSHVLTPKDDLILTGKDILEQSKSFINMQVGD